MSIESECSKESNSSKEWVDDTPEILVWKLCDAQINIVRRLMTLEKAVFGSVEQTMKANKSLNTKDL